MESLSSVVCSNISSNRFSSSLALDNTNFVAVYHRLNTARAGLLHMSGVGLASALLRFSCQKESLFFKGSWHFLVAIWLPQVRIGKVSIGKYR